MSGFPVPMMHYPSGEPPPPIIEAAFNLASAVFVNWTGVGAGSSNTPNSCPQWAPGGGRYFIGSGALPTGFGQISVATPFTPNASPVGIGPVVGVTPTTTAIDRYGKVLITSIPPLSISRYDWPSYWEAADVLSPVQVGGSENIGVLLLPQDISPSGHVIIGVQGGVLRSLPLSSPFNITAGSRGSITSTTPLSSTGASTAMVARFSSDGTKIYIGFNTPDEVRQYSLGTPFDISTMGAPEATLAIPGTVATVVTGIGFSDDQTRLFVSGHKVGQGAIGWWDG